MALAPGTRLGTFEILGPLGAGGMGEVYRARDTRLGRDVAIKVLPEAFAQDPMRAARFEREARLLASVNHPAIAAIYGAETSGSLQYIVMELVPGETLGEKVTGGALGLEESLLLSRQIAEALEAAHEKGVVHRDLKPSNIKVTPEGKVKVLDLGLAKAMEPPPSEDISKSPTMVAEQTRPGVILGTVEFMSPEQARGKPVDKRTDIWAFGCILFEMLSGKRAFSGETVSDILAAILASPPDWQALPQQIPVRVRHLLGRCLEKDQSRRLRDIGDARIEIELALAELSSGVAALGAPARRRFLHVPLIAAAVLLAAAAAWWAARRQPHPPPGASREKYLAVLPFKDLSGSAEGQLVGDGLVETVSVRLARVSGVQVVTPSAAVAAADKETDPARIARDLGANLILRGAIQREGDQVRITYSVLNVREGIQVTGGDVTGPASELFAMQDRLTDSVAAALELPRASSRTPPPSGLETAGQQTRYTQAVGYLQRYDRQASVDEAIRLLEALATERPGSAPVHAALARGYLFRYNLTRDKQWAEKALVSSRQAKQLNADLPEVDVTLGELALRTGRPMDSIASFQRALAVRTNNIDALLGLARAYDASKETHEAEATYLRAIALAPAYWQGYSKLGGFYYSHGQIPRAAEMFYRVTELTPDNANAYSNLGGMRELMGDFDKALEAYRKSIAIQPTALAYSNLGTLEYFLGNYKESSESFERAVKLAPKDFSYWAELGDAYRWTPGLQDRSQAAYERAIQLGKDELAVNRRNAFAHAKLAICFAKTENRAEARKRILQAIDLDPKNPDYMYDAAVVAIVGGDRAEALRSLRRAVEAGYGTAHIEREPEFASLREEKSFQELIKPASPKGL